ncbi:MAG: LCP family protein [Dysosmobacter sp.]|nr:LCP family protein [Dysosmobacter sp.]
MSNIGKRLAGNQTPKPQKPQGPRRGKLTCQQIVLIVIVALLAAALLITLAWRSLFVRPTLPNRDSAQNATDLDGDGLPDSGGIDWGDGTRPRADGERKSEDYYTVLILGRDTGGGGNTDTILLASYDVTNQKASIMSIPRDTMVNIPYDIKRINAVYNYYGQGEKGIQHLYKEISQLVGFEPDYQVVIEWEAVGKIVDAMGGVWFDVPRDMNYRDPWQDLTIKQAKGYRLLSGDDAMQVLRYRYDTGKKSGYADGDIGRIATQQALLKAMVQQLLQVKNIAKINEFAKVFQECVETDLSLQNCLWFAQAAYLGGLKVEDVNFVTAPGNYAAHCWSRTYQNMQSYVTLYPNQLLKLVNEELSPFKEVFTLSDLDIMTVNADGSVSSSSGYVEDQKAAIPPVRPEPEPEENEDEPAVDENGNPIDPDTGLPIVVDPENGGSAGTTTPGNSDPGTGTSPAPDPGPEIDTPDIYVPDPGPETPSSPDPVESDSVEPDPVPELPEVPQDPSDPGFTFIEPPPNV